MPTTDTAPDSLTDRVRVFIFTRAAETGRVPQPAEIATGLGLDRGEVEEAVRQLGEGRVVILAPNSLNIWAADPFAAVPTGFRVEAKDRTYWGICIWDALGIPAALGSDGVITAPCGDCGESLTLEVRDGTLVQGEGVIHFGVPAHQWWENIGFT